MLILAVLSWKNGREASERVVVWLSGNREGGGGGLVAVQVLEEGEDGVGEKAAARSCWPGLFCQESNTGRSRSRFPELVSLKITCSSC